MIFLLHNRYNNRHRSISDVRYRTVTGWMKVNNGFYLAEETTYYTYPINGSQTGKK